MRVTLDAIDAEIGTQSAQQEGLTMTRRTLPRLRVALVIVASILLAFGIDAWWAGRQESQRTHTVLVGLQEEFAEQRAALAADLDRELVRKKRLEGMFQAIASGTPLAPGSGDTLLFDITYAPTFDPGSGRLDALDIVLNWAAR